MPCNVLELFREGEEQGLLPELGDIHNRLVFVPTLQRLVAPFLEAN